MSALPPCPACGGAFGAHTPYPGADAHASVLRFEAIVECGTCALGMALPLYPQSALDAYYAGGAYWNDAVGHSRAQALHERNQCRHRVRHVLCALPADTRPRVLDVGAGHGWTADFFDRLSGVPPRTFDFIEPDEDLSAQILAREARFPKRRISTLAASEGPYDAIFLNHVLEHVAEPLACVRQVIACLAPGGVAYFETPYADQRFKADVFPHTWFFTPEALAQLARASGSKEVLREAFGRMPGKTGFDLMWRAAFRASAEAGLVTLAGRFDDRVWRYAPARDGIWLRWMVRRA